MYIAIDFDGTIVTHEYPAIGIPVKGAIEKMQEWQEQGHRLILYTMRSGEKLSEAASYLSKNNINLYGINENPSQHKWTASRKVYAHVYIDDAAYGCPLIYPKVGRPWVDWSKIQLSK